MHEKHEHHRDDEQFSEYHQREEDDQMPGYMKWIANFINRIGFPIFAFVVMTYFCFVTLERNTNALIELKEVMISVKATLDHR